MLKREKKHRTGAFRAQKQTVKNQGLKGCPPKGSHVKVRNDQSEHIVEILTEYVTKEWPDQDKRRKNVDEKLKRGSGFPLQSIWQLLSRDIKSKERGLKQRSKHNHVSGVSIQSRSNKFREGSSAGFRLEGT